jgi:hypothetical protein
MDRISSRIEGIGARSAAAAAVPAVDDGFRGFSRFEGDKPEFRERPRNRGFNMDQPPVHRGFDSGPAASAPDQIPVSVAPAADAPVADASAAPAVQYGLSFPKGRPTDRSDRPSDRGSRDHRSPRRSHRSRSRDRSRRSRSRDRSARDDRPRRRSPDRRRSRSPPRRRSRSRSRSRERRRRSRSREHRRRSRSREHRRRSRSRERGGEGSRRRRSRSGSRERRPARERSAEPAVKTEPSGSPARGDGAAGMVRVAEERVREAEWWWC